MVPVVPKTGLNTSADDLHVPPVVSTKLIVVAAALKPSSFRNRIKGPSGRSKPAGDGVNPGIEFDSIGIDTPHDVPVFMLNATASMPPNRYALACDSSALNTSVADVGVRRFTVAVPKGVDQPVRAASGAERVYVTGVAFAAWATSKRRGSATTASNRFIENLRRGKRLESHTLEGHRKTSIP
jgi:hypothetical protein